jgi:hypothetical protein
MQHGACRQNLQRLHELFCKMNNRGVHRQPPTRKGKVAKRERKARRRAAQRKRKKRHQPNEFPPPKKRAQSHNSRIRHPRALPCRLAARLTRPLAVWSLRGRRAGPDPAPWRRALGGGRRIRSSPPPSACRTPPTGTESLSPCLLALVCYLAPGPALGW